MEDFRLVLTPSCDLARPDTSTHDGNRVLVACTVSHYTRLGEVEIELGRRLNSRQKAKIKPVLTEGSRW